jgi:hypothetical protein
MSHVTSAVPTQARLRPGSSSAQVSSGLLRVCLLRNMAKLATVIGVEKAFSSCPEEDNEDNQSTFEAITQYT